MKDNPRADLGKLVLRLALGLLILLHGIAKLRGGLGQITGLVESHGLPGFIGYGVLVGPPRRTAASYRMENVAATLAWLEQSR